MNFLGMGFLEILIILIIAFIFLGPERMVDAARMLGKLVREARNIASEVPRVVVDDDDIKIVSGGETTSLTGQPAPPTSAKPPAANARAEPDATAESADDDGGAPVSFARGSAPPALETRNAKPDASAESESADDGDGGGPVSFARGSAPPAPETHSAESRDRADR